MPCRHRWRCVSEIQYKCTHTHAWTCLNAADHSCLYGSPDGPHDNTTHRGNCSPWELHTYSTNMHNLSEAYTKPDFKVRITYLLLSMCCLAVRVWGGWGGCCLCGHHCYSVKSVSSYLQDGSLSSSVSLAVAPLSLAISHSPPSITSPSFLTFSLSHWHRPCLSVEVCADTAGVCHALLLDTAQ